MTSYTFNSLILKAVAIISTVIILSACGGGASNSETATTPTPKTPTPDETDYCKQQVSGINWNALLNNNCENLSDYNLFTDATDPTNNPTAGGIPYDLSTALFTDYASKYRFIFVPDGESATYSNNEVMEFPVGSVLVKTFALPDDTANRTGAQTVIETRLLINRDSGWIALPYYWEASTDAKFIVIGKSVDITITHDSSLLNFTYEVPRASDCAECHAIVPMLQDSNDVRRSIFKPIGPKARFLNNDFLYSDGLQNQLTYWENAGILTGAPVDKTSVDTAANFHDADSISATKTAIDALSSDELATAARSYLDINCAHCHRSELSLVEPFYEGPAGDSGLRLEFNRMFDPVSTDFGTCKKALASGEDDHPFDIVPGHSEVSYLPFRMNSLEGTHKMPELGRSTIHQEGVYLIEKWIDDMPENTCGLTLAP
jgi:uncharacterized repeat protein (TIGR03806 family)